MIRNDAAVRFLEKIMPDQQDGTRRRFEERHRVPRDVIDRPAALFPAAAPAARGEVPLITSSNERRLSPGCSSFWLP
jgi:hypothetical protein